MNLDLKSYSRFVESVTSDESNYLSKFNERVEELSSESWVNLPLLITASMGLTAESGEFTEVVKKIFFQGKPLDEDNKFHMKRELGDILWYWVNACNALELDPFEVMMENVEKLQSRYPGGEFDSWFSENRKDGDL